MRPWELLARATAPDGEILQLCRRGEEFLVRVGGKDLMSSEDEISSRAQGELGCAHLQRSHASRVLVGGLGMGFTLRAALDCVGPEAMVEVAELVEAVVQWNRAELGPLAGHPLRDRRCELHVGDVQDRIRDARSRYDAILLDVDNGPDALAHDANAGLYSERGIALARAALRPGGVLTIWSFSDDPGFTSRLTRGGFDARIQRVPASRKGRGRHHHIWLAVRPPDRRANRSRRSNATRS